ncbi:MAG: class I SAM-dependent RNA methyltransferase [Pseudomonadota bacterium]
METYKIDRLGVRCDGVAEGSIYASRSLPGEVVEGELDGNKLSNLRIIEPSSDRVTPVCVHYHACGGCQVQHASEIFVADWKTGLIRAALSAQGLKANVRPIVTSPTASRRRATFAARRTKKDAMAGFHKQASDVIVEIPKCEVITPELMMGLPVAEDLARLAASRKGELSVAVTQSDVGLDITVSGGKVLDGPLRNVLSDLAARHDIARLSYEDEIIVTRRKPFQLFDDITVHPPPKAFLQATKDAEKTLQDEVKSIVGDASSIVDLFAGCGTFALPLAKQSRVHAVEGDGEMLGCLDHAWRNTEGLKAVSVQTRDLFRNPLSSDELSKFEAVVIDPPRAGAQAQTLQLASSQIPIIAYVSCNPTSFARDAKCLLEAGYQLDWVLPIDQFRWSAHVELVAAFRL